MAEEEKCEVEGCENESEWFSPAEDMDICEECMNNRIDLGLKPEYYCPK